MSILLFFVFAMTRGLTEDDFEKVAIFFDRAVTITQNIAKETGIRMF